MDPQLLHPHLHLYRPFLHSSSAFLSFTSLTYVCAVNMTSGPNPHSPHPILSYPCSSPAIAILHRRFSFVHGSGMDEWSGTEKTNAMKWNGMESNGLMGSGESVVWIVTRQLYLSYPNLFYHILFIRPDSRQLLGQGCMSNAYLLYFATAADGLISDEHSLFSAIYCLIVTMDWMNHTTV